MEGYYDLAKQDWSLPHDKGFTPTADAMTCHAAVMAMRNIAPTFRTRFLTLADRITDKILPAPYLNSISPLINEFSNSNWVPYGKELFNGHAVKCAWQLGRAYLLEPKEIYRNKSQQVLNEAIDRGYFDNTNGGLHYFQKGGPKNAWTQEQAILAGILNSTITDDPILKIRYLKLADDCMRFVEDHLIDYRNGGSYTDVDSVGSVTTYPKGDYWEAGYHITEMAYYVYLYGNVHLYNKPVELYYYFSTQGEAQTHKLTPFEIADNKLAIETVFLDDQIYTDFNSSTRTLHIPAGQGGKFKVKFRPIDDVTTGELLTYSEVPESVLKVYPIPVKSDFLTVEGVQLTKGESVSVKITDLHSEVLFEQTYHSAYALEIPVSQLRAGVYFLYVNDKVKSFVKEE